MLFFQEPNQRKTTLMLFFLAFIIVLSTNVKSNLPSSGSNSSQYTGVQTVLRCICFSFGQTCRMYCKLEALEFPNSPPSIRKGLLLTTICVAEPCFCKWGRF